MLPAGKRIPECRVPGEIIVLCLKGIVKFGVGAGAQLLRRGHPQLVNVLVDAAKRGVDVRIILPGRSDSASAFYAVRSHYEDLLDAGVKIYERRGALLHAKIAIVDGVWSCVGSSNLDWRSALDNDEINAVVLIQTFAQRMESAFDEDMAASDEIGRESWKHRSLLLRVKE